MKFGTHSFSEVGRVGQCFDGTVEWKPDFVKNYVKGETDEHNEVPEPVYRPNSLLMSSSISCIRKCSSHAVNDGPFVGHALYPFDFILQLLHKHYGNIFMHVCICMYVCMYVR